MVTKPGNKFRPRTPKGEEPVVSIGSTFVDVDKLNAAEITKLTIRISKTLHKDVKARALSDDTSVQEFVQTAIIEKLARTPAS